MFEPGVMFWAERDDLAVIRTLGVRYGQLGVPGGMQLADAAAEWKAKVAEIGIEVVTVFAAYNGKALLHVLI